jgi:hypothetical protein
VNSIRNSLYVLWTLPTAVALRPAVRNIAHRSRVCWEPVNMLCHNELGQHCCAAEAASRVIKYFGQGKIRLKQEFAARKLHANFF